MSARDDPRLATPGHAVLSPSGRYELEVVEGAYRADEGRGRWWRIRIRKRHGEVALDWSMRFSARFATEVLWDERVPDRAWVNSSDVGTFFCDRGRDEKWSCHSLGPSGIASGEPRVPKLLLDLHPEDFGAKGRERARRVLREQGRSSGSLDLSTEDPRLMKPR